MSLNYSTMKRGYWSIRMDMSLVDVAVTLSTLIVLEIVLGVDNLIFLSILTEKLPKHNRQRARYWGLT
ncbi:MAG: hypothetical protein WCR08_06900, partial [Gammaproteobacteria bacterium]